MSKSLINNSNSSLPSNKMTQTRQTCPRSSSSSCNLCCSNNCCFFFIFFFIFFFLFFDIFTSAFSFGAVLTVAHSPLRASLHIKILQNTNANTKGNGLTFTYIFLHLMFEWLRLAVINKCSIYFSNLFHCLCYNLSTKLHKIINTHR